MAENFSAMSEVRLRSTWYRVMSDRRVTGAELLSTLDKIETELLARHAGQPEELQVPIPSRPFFMGVRA